MLRFISTAIALLLSPCLSQAQTTEPTVTAQGAAGDGETDDTAAIQKAIDSGVGGLRFPRGSYRLTQTVVIDLDKVGFTSLVGDGTARIIMAGAGPAFKFVGTHAGSAAPSTFKPDVWERQRSPMVDGLEILGAHPEADGIEATGTMQLTITRTVVREARHGIHLTVRNRNVIISDCHLYHNSGVGVFYDHVDLHQSNISGCHISYNAGGGVVSLGGGVRNLHIGTCDIESNMTPEAPPTANVLIDCTGGSTAEVTIVGCTIQHNPSPGAANVRFIGKGIPRPDSPDIQWGHLTIADNVLSDVEINIDLQHVRGAVITGNTFGGGYERDLHVTHSSNIAVGSNTFDRNPPYYRGKAEAAKGGLLFQHCRDITLTGLHVDGIRSHPAALVIENSDTFNISGCTILDSDGAGILMQEVSNSLLTGNLIADRRQERQPAPSIHLIGGSDNTLANNKLAHGTEPPSQ
jgi:parallel beta-helix repeat protein